MAWRGTLFSSTISFLGLGFKKLISGGREKERGQRQFLFYFYFYKWSLPSLCRFVFVFVPGFLGGFSD